MKRRYFPIGVLFFVLALPATAIGQQRFPDNPIEGARLFSEKGCFRCHSIFGKGGHIGHDLARIKLGSQLDVASAMLNHAQTMADKMGELKIIWPHLSGQEIDSVITYLYYVNYFDEMGDATTGERLFQNRGCNRCHSLSAAAPKEAPPLSAFPRNISPIYLAKTLWNHGPRMQSEMAQRGIAWPRLEGTEITDLVAYFKGIAHGEPLASYPPGNPNEGRKVFEAKGCTRCHGQGGGGMAPNLADRAQDLKQSLTEVVARMWNHAPQIFSRMREVQMKVPDFTEKEMADLVAYIYFLNYFAPPPDLVAGRKLFADKHCSTCHAVGSGMQGIGPDLSLSQKGAPIDIVSAMWNHALLMQNLMREQEIPWPQFEKGKLNNLIGYIQSLKKPERPLVP